jgi:DNA polymerase-3 subunit epsilon
MMSTLARREAIQIAQEYLGKNPLYLDTETTGIGPHDNILEIAIIDQEGNTLVDTLVKPVGVISPEAISVHGIHADMVQEAPSWSQVWPQVEAVLTGRPVGIYNAEFDLRMMEQSHQRNWMQWALPRGTGAFCIMKLYAQFYGQWNARHRNYRWHSLDSAGRQCGIPLPNSHRARDDTLLTRAVLHHIAGYPS